MNRRSFLIWAVSTTAVLAQGARADQATGSLMTQQEASKLLELFNEARAEVGVPPLSWSREIAADAQDWAEYLASSGKFEHSSGRYGENLAGAMDVEEAAAAWLSEKSLYDGGPIGPNWIESGHYTQVVWRDTTKVGCGKTPTPDYIVWVCCFDPPGNVEGRRPY